MSEDTARTVEWRSLPWLDGYEVSESGAVRRTRAMANNALKAGEVLRGSLCAKGYQNYTLHVGGKKRRFLAQRLVCEAWHGPPFAGAEAAHWDGSRLNNHFSNLRWATHAENERDKDRHGTRRRGNAHPLSKLTEDGVRWMRLEYSRGTLRQVDFVRHFGVSKAVIWRALRGDTWAAVS
jgi:hypothetical protein